MAELAHTVNGMARGAAVTLARLAYFLAEAVLKRVAAAAIKVDDEAAVLQQRRLAHDAF
jgi:hypothetical protein